MTARHQMRGWLSRLAGHWRPRRQVPGQLSPAEALAQAQARAGQLAQLLQAVGAERRALAATVRQVAEERLQAAAENQRLQSQLAQRDAELDEAWQQAAVILVDWRRATRNERATPTLGGLLNWAARRLEPNTAPVPDDVAGDHPTTTPGHVAD